MLEDYRIHKNRKERDQSCRRFGVSVFSGDCVLGTDREQRGPLSGKPDGSKWRRSRSRMGKYRNIITSRKPARRLMTSDYF